MKSTHWSFLVRYPMYLMSIILDLSQAHPLKGMNVRDATSSDHLTFVVSIARDRYPESHFCTGTLITLQSVLTSEHCIIDEDRNKIRIIIGSTDLRLGRKYRVAKWKSFSQWHQTIQDIEETSDDIAILILSTRVNDPNVKPASIEYNKVQYYSDHSQFRMAGWGYIEDDTRPMILKTGLVKLIPLRECIERGKNITGDEKFEVPCQHFCSMAEPWLLANFGDSGGPTLNGANKLVAITRGICPHRMYFSTSDQVCNANLLNVHLNLLRYRKFIEAVAVE